MSSMQNIGRQVISGVVCWTLGSMALAQPPEFPAPGEAKPAVVQEGAVTINLDNLAPDPKLNVLRLTIDDPSGANAAAMKAKSASANRGEISKRLNGWFKEGTAAGNVDDFYDNRDGAHSQLPLANHPQLSRIVYGKSLQEKQMHYALQAFFISNRVILGNSSTAMVGHPFWRSNPRRALVNGRAMQALYAQYVSNQVYFYPEHQDHDIGHNGRGGGYGDVFPANQPYVVTSQGSSGSDGSFMDAFANTLAAFHPEVKRKLAEKGLLMPALQMIFRSTQKNVQTAERYLHGVAHPAAFDSQQLDLDKMLEVAHAMKPDNLPPLAKLQVIDEDTGVLGRDYFEVAEAERLFDTPCAIARVVRSTRQLKRIVVSAKESFDADGRPLTLHWVVLRGKLKFIEIKPVNEQKTIVELLIPFHERRVVKGGSRLESNRVDIGVFAHNGGYYSAPSFVSFYFLDDEARTYAEDGRILEVDYDGGDTTIGDARENINVDDPNADIADWPGLLRLVAGESDSLAARLLREQFKPAELAELAKASRELDAAHDAQRSAQTMQQAVETEFQAAADKSKELNDKRALANHRLDEARKAAARVLTKDRPPLGSAMARLEAALNSLHRNPDFYRAHEAELTALPAEGDAQQRVAATRQRLIDEGIFAIDASGNLQRTSVLAAEKLAGPTNYERKQLELFHQLVMRRLLYPNQLRPAFRRNYADPLVATQKSWRDVYHYDAMGRRTGWTRWRQGAKQEFTATGELVLDKDEQGRPSKSRAVKYVGKNEPNQIPQLEQQDGDTTSVIKYASPEDRVGVAERQP